MKLRLIIISFGVLVLHANVFAAEWRCFQYTTLHSLVINEHGRTIIMPLNEKVDDFLAKFKGNSLCVKGTLSFDQGWGFNQVDLDS
ncbi:MAG: hypothetical protein ABL927_08170, partial [Bdellovibrionales bacterium]